MISRTKVAMAAGTVALACLAGGCSQTSTAPPGVTGADLAVLRGELSAAQAQGSIRSLLHAYGRLIDARDWDGFAKIWTDDAVYVGGPGSEKATGGPAIAQFLHQIIAANPSGVGEPNFHVFFNEEIEVSGDQARATSMSTFVTPGAAGAPTMVMLARYEDDLVRRDGEWRFQRRVVKAQLPAPKPKAR